MEYSSDQIYYLWRKIQENYLNNKHEKTIELIKEYMKIENVGITVDLLNIYLMCNIKINNFTEALKYLIYIENNYKDYFNKCELVIRYIQCFKTEEAKNIINSNEFSDKEYLNIAKQLSLYGEFSFAQECLNLCINKTTDNNIKKEAEKTINKINKHITEGTFIEQNYYKFLMDGKELEKGHVIYGKVSNCTYVNSDPKHDARPYMIWKVTDSEVYCLPLTINMHSMYSSSYTLYHQNYSHFDYDVKIKENVAIIKKKNIHKVIEKVNEQDLEIILRNLYKNIYFEDSENKTYKQDFTYDYLRNLKIKPGEIIYVIDRGTKEKKYYYVIDADYDSQKYKTIEVKKSDANDEYSILSYNPVYIKMSKLIFDVHHVSEEEQQKLNSEIMKNIKKELKPGDIIICDNRKLIVVQQGNDKWLCSDKTIDSDIVMPYYITEDQNYKYIGTVPKEKLKREISKLNSRKCLTKKKKRK